MSERRPLSFLLLAMLLLYGAPAAADERADLLKKQKTLEERVAALEKEQAFLNFQKEFYLSDSKYVLLRPAEGVGELRYRHRLLKRFTFAAPKRSALRTLNAGALALTAKKDGKRDRHVMVFGDALIIQSKRAAAPSVKRSRALVIGLTREDLVSVHAALEVGAQLYVLK